MDYPVTPDGRYFGVRGRLWRCSNPKLPPEKREKLLRALMLARRQKDRDAIDKAKRARGEQGPVWWKGVDYNRYRAKNTPFAQWFRGLENDSQLRRFTHAPRVTRSPPKA